MAIIETYNNRLGHSIFANIFLLLILPCQSNMHVVRRLSVTQEISSMERIDKYMIYYVMYMYAY